MKNQIKTILLLGIPSAILIGFGAMPGRQRVAAFTLLAMALNDPEALASALEKLERDAHSTHPPAAERVRRLRGMQFARYAA